MLESPQHTAQDTKHERQTFYRLVYQKVRGKMDMPDGQLQSLIFHLLGGSEVEKHYRGNSRRNSTITPYDRAENRERNSRRLTGNRVAGYYYCGELGHFKVNCNQQKRDLRALEENNGASQPSTN